MIVPNKILFKFSYGINVCVLKKLCAKLRNYWWSKSFTF